MICQAAQRVTFERRKPIGSLGLQIAPRPDSRVRTVDRRSKAKVTKWAEKDDSCRLVVVV